LIGLRISITRPPPGFARQRRERRRARREARP
jgi:hypothetical protein